MTVHMYSRSTLASLFSATAQAVAANEISPDEAVSSVVAILDAQQHPMVASQLAAHWSAVNQDDPFMAAVQARMLIASTALALAL